MAEQSLVDLGAAMAALRVDEQGADFRLLVEGEEVRVHSQVLAARSPFFRTGINFPTEGAAKEMTIEGRSAAAVREAVNFMYGIPIREGVFDDAGNLTEGFSDYEGLLDIAEFFMMDDFKDEVDRFVTKNVKLTEENFVATSKLADTFRARQLADKCGRFLLASAAETAWAEVEQLPVVAAAGIRLARAAVQAVRDAQPCAANTSQYVRDCGGCGSTHQNNGRSHCFNCDHALVAASSTCQLETMKKEVAKFAEA